MPNATLATRRYGLGIELAKASVKLFAGWVLAIVVVAVVLPAVIYQFRSIDISTWHIIASAGNIATAIVAGTFLYTLFPITVAQGMTRREICVSMGIFGLLWSAIFGVVAAAGYFAEYAYYGLFDWAQGVPKDDGDAPLESLSDVAATAVAYPLLYLMYFTAGALIGAAAYRWDGGWLILAPIAPIILALDAALTSRESFGPGWLRWASTITDDTHTLTGLIAAIAAVGLAAWLTRHILVDTPIRSKKP
jgi:hypothetical protein